MNKRLDCIDAGSEYCPCYLAETNECITCSQLQGKNFCDCNWRGVCIYQQFVWSGFKRKSQRNYMLVDILEKRNIGRNVLILKLKTTTTMARELEQPGSYIFMRNPEKPYYFDVPMSVLWADKYEGYIEVAVQIVGSKTKQLEECQKNVMIRGPYWNGIFGHRYLKLVKNSKCLIFVRGIAQAPGVLIAKKLKQANNKILMVVDPGKVSTNFMNEYIKDMNIEVIEIDLTSIKGQKISEQLIKDREVKLIFSGGSDRQHYNILKMLNKHNHEAYLLVTNNNLICCGEGICGSCTVKLEDGKKVKSCKVQLDIWNDIERRVLHD